MKHRTYFWNGLCIGLLFQEIGHGLYLHNSDYAQAIFWTLIGWIMGLFVCEDPSW